MEATSEIAQAIRKIPELEVIGDPKVFVFNINLQVCVVSFKAKRKGLNIYAIEDEINH